MRALVLVNSGARQGAAYGDRARKQLWAMGVDVMPAPAGRLAAWPGIIRDWADHVDCVVVGGGDGTLNFASGPIMANNLTMAVLPLGTANDFARTLGLPDDPIEACRVVADGTNHRVDMGRVNDVRFLNVASIGLSVRARRYRSDRAKRRFGTLGYTGNVYAAFRDTRPFRVRIRAGGECHDLSSIQLAIGNGRHFGGGLAIANDAALDDGRLDLFNLEPQNIGALMRLIPTLIRGPGPAIRGGQLLSGTQFRVITTRPRSVNTDGEILTKTPAVFRIQPQALAVRVPRAYREAFVERENWRSEAP